MLLLLVILLSVRDIFTSFYVLFGDHTDEATVISASVLVVMRAVRIMTVITRTEVSTGDARLVTLTVVLKALGLATIAALEVMLRGSSHRRSRRLTSHHFLLLKVVALLAV